MVDRTLELRRWLLVAVLKKDIMLSLAENAVKEAMQKVPLKQKPMFMRDKQQTSALNLGKSAKPTG